MVAAKRVVLVIGLCILHNRKSRDWGFNADAFWQSLAWSALLTAIFGGALWWIGWASTEVTFVPVPRDARDGGLA